MYTDIQRKNDFDYFVEHYKDFYDQYGHCFLGIKDGSVLAHAQSISELIAELNPHYEFGSYIIQECKEDESAFKSQIMRLMIHA